MDLAKDFQEIKLINKNKLRYWEPFMKKYKCNYICELGISKGYNFYEMIKHNPKLGVAVDSWTDDGIISRNDGGYSQEELDQQYQDFVLSVSDKPFIEVHREYTFEAVKHFPDNYFDFVYIDADHTYEGCLRDIKDWYPKVKKGKFLIGDDYRIYEGRRVGIKFEVIEAVNEFVKDNNLELFKLPKYGWGIVKN